MWEKINKVQAQVIACMVIILMSFGLAYWAAVNGIPKSAELFVNKVTDIALMGAIAWLFTMSKSNSKPPTP
jgi:hypothetical protein